MTDVLRYSSLTTVRSGIHAEMATAGMRTPDRSKVNPISPGGADGSGGGAGDGGTWSKQPPCSSKVTRRSVLNAFDPFGEPDDRTASYTLASSASPPNSDEGGSTAMPWNRASQAGCMSLWPCSMLGSMKA